MKFDGTWKGLWKIWHLESHEIPIPFTWYSLEAGRDRMQNVGACGWSAPDAFVQVSVQTGAFVQKFDLMRPRFLEIVEETAWLLRKGLTRSSGCFAWPFYLTNLSGSSQTWSRFSQGHMNHSLWARQQDQEKKQLYFISWETRNNQIVPLNPLAELVGV